MANSDIKKGFKVVSPHLYQPIKYLLNALYAGEQGDVASLGTDGYATDTLTAVVLGIQASGISTLASQEVVSAAVADADSFAMFVIDTEVEFVGQISTFAATAPYTTRSSAACFDVAGSAGGQYIDAAASTLDQIKVIGLSTEYDTGLESVVGANAKVLAKFNPLAHAFGAIA